MLLIIINHYNIIVIIIIIIIIDFLLYIYIYIYNYISIIKPQLHPILPYAWFTRWLAREGLDIHHLQTALVTAVTSVFSQLEKPTTSKKREPEVTSDDDFIEKKPLPKRFVGILTIVIIVSYIISYFILMADHYPQLLRKG